MGPIVGVILGALVIIGLIARIMLPTADSPLGDTATDTNRAAAYELMGSMTAVSQGFQTMQSQRGINPNLILFNGSETGLNGTAAALITDSADVLYTRQLFHPVAGTIASPPIFPASASAAADPRAAQYYYRNHFALRGGAGAVPLEMGTTAAEIAIYAPNIRPGVCLSVNAQLNSDSETDTTAIPSSGLALSAFTGTDSTAASLVTSPDGLRARSAGCVATTDGAYVAFVVLAKR